MSSSNNNTLGCVDIQWSIENFHLCWQRTGEKLESPLFNVDFSTRTSWRLWLYPRGADDGEHISFFLFREEGGPEEVHVDFELYLNIAGSSIGHNSGTYYSCSFKIRQKRGLKCFVSRREIFTEKETEMDKLVFHFGCIVSSRKTEVLSEFEQIMFTRIENEVIHGTEVFDNVTDLDPQCNIEVKPMLENEALINIKLSYFEDSLVIKILPVNCKKIKFAICKVTVIKNWVKESPIKHVRSWIGEIKADICRYQVLHTETDSSTQELNILTDKIFFVHYDFTFSTGEAIALCGFQEYDGYLLTGDTSFEHYLNLKSIKYAPTALDALQEIYISESFTDFYVRSETKTYLVHKAILYVRSPKFRTFLDHDRESNGTFSTYPYFEDLFLFLYTDALENVYELTALQLYKKCFQTDIELLQMKCRNLLIADFNKTNAAAILNVASLYNDLLLKSTIENYIAIHYELVISSSTLEEFKEEPEFRKELLFLKYKKQRRKS